jgi:two-component system chemotaxis response regulator CheB
MAVKNAGGLAIVQSPSDALISSMPLNAIQNVEVDHIVEAAGIARLLIETCEERAMDAKPSSGPLGAVAPADEGRDITLSGAAPDQLRATQGDPSTFACPECGGSLWEFHEGSGFRFRCHTGHGFTPDSLLMQQTAHLENALWTAVRVLQERATLHRQLAQRCVDRGLDSAAARHEDQAHQAQLKAGMLRDLIGKTVQQSPPPPTNPGA